MTTPTTAPLAERLAAFEKDLQAHDWRFEFSDDPGAFRRGLRERDQLEAMRRALIADGHKAEVDALWRQHCPSGASA